MLLMGESAHAKHPKKEREREKVKEAAAVWWDPKCACVIERRRGGWQRRGL